MGDYSRTRLASDVGSGKKTFSGLFDCMQKTAAGPGGFMALYTGFGVSVVGIVGYRGLQLGTFDTITGLNPYKKDKGIMGAVTTFGAAQTAITIGAGATYPSDTVRRRLQMQSEKPVEEHLYKGTMHCFKKIAAEEGMAKGLYKVSLRTSSAALAVHWCSSCTTALRCIWASEAVLHINDFLR